MHDSNNDLESPGPRHDLLLLPVVVYTTLTHKSLLARMLFKRYPDGSPLSVVPKSGRVRSPGMGGAGPRGLVASEGAQLELEPVPDAPTALSGASLTPPDRPLVGSMCHQRHARRLLSQRCDDLRWWATP